VPDDAATGDSATSVTEETSAGADDRAVRPARRALLERFERASGIPEREVKLVDARAIRAIAHEARQRVIDVLYTEQRSYTATQLAELTGLSPSAMSYHLRALERWGVIERAAEATDDARTRPWRATGTSITVTGEGTAVEAAQDVLFANTMAALRQRMRALRTLPKHERMRYVGLASGELWLTDQQIEDFSLVVERAVVELAESGWVNEPDPDRTRTAFVWSLLPDPYPGQAGPGHRGEGPPRPA
jgi:DNA-binding transcriptional ArsR family regulator